MLFLRLYAEASGKTLKNELYLKTGKSVTVTVAVRAVLVTWNYSMWLYDHTYMSILW